MISSVFLLVIGFAALFFGGELLVRGATALGNRIKLPELLIGSMIVAFCTSSPELVASIQASLKGHPELALGNVVGSNIANILLIIGFGACMNTLPIDRKRLFPDTLFMMFCSILVAVILWHDQNIGRIEGSVLVLLLVGFLFWNYRNHPQPSFEGATEATTHWLEDNIPAQLTLIIFGVGLLIFGGDWLVTGAVSIAKYFGVSTAVIGLTIVAIGTSLPELAVTIVACIRGKTDLALGNAIGSNVWNLMCVLGLTALVAPIDQGQIGWGTIGLMLLVALVMLAFVFYLKNIRRLIGVVFLLVYASYTVYLFQ